MIGFVIVAWRPMRQAELADDTIYDTLTDATESAVWHAEQEAHLPRRARFAVHPVDLDEAAAAEVMAT
jgi:hypothetical protein